jgi:hypothetical protein
MRKTEAILLYCFFVQSVEEYLVREITDLYELCFEECLALQDTLPMRNNKKNNKACCSLGIPFQEGSALQRKIAATFLVNRAPILTMCAFKEAGKEFAVWQCAFQDQ